MYLPAPRRHLAGRLQQGWSVPPRPCIKPCASNTAAPLPWNTPQGAITAGQRLASSCPGMFATERQPAPPPAWQRQASPPQGDPDVVCLLSDGDDEQEEYEDEEAERQQEGEGQQEAPPQAQPPAAECNAAGDGEEPGPESVQSPWLAFPSLAWSKGREPTCGVGIQVSAALGCGAPPACGRPVSPARLVCLCVQVHKKHPGFVVQIPASGSAGWRAGTALAGVRGLGGITWAVWRVDLGGMAACPAGSCAEHRQRGPRQGGRVQQQGACGAGAGRRRHLAHRAQRVQRHLGDCQGEGLGCASPGR